MNLPVEKLATFAGSFSGFTAIHKKTWVSMIALAKETILDFTGQRVVEIVGNGELPACPTQFTPLWQGCRYQFRDRHVGAHDHYLFTVCDSL